MVLYSESYKDAEEFMQSLGWLWPERLHEPAFDLAVQLGKVVVKARDNLSSDVYTDPAEAALIDELSHTTLTFGAYIINKIPVSAYNKLQRERTKIVKQDGLIELPTVEADTITEPDINPWKLSEEELAIFKLLPQGLKNREIGEIIGVRDVLITGRMREILTKTDSRGRASAAVLAYKTYKEIGEAPITPAEEEAFLSLTPKQLSVLSFMDKDLSYREIGDLVFITGQTVDSHLAKIYQKLGITNRVQAAVFAYRAHQAGLFELGAVQSPPPAKKTLPKPKASNKPETENNEPNPPEEKLAATNGVGLIERYRSPSRYKFMWEGELEEMTAEVLARLAEAAGAQNLKELKMPIKAGPRLQHMLEQGLVTAMQAEQGEFDIKQAVKAILLGTTKGKSLILGWETKAQALKSIDEQIDRFIAIAAIKAGA